MGVGKGQYVVDLPSYAGLWLCPPVRIRLFLLFPTPVSQESATRVVALRLSLLQQRLAAQRTAAKRPLHLQTLAARNLVQEIAARSVTLVADCDVDDSVFRRSGAGGNQVCDTSGGLKI